MLGEENCTWWQRLEHEMNTSVPNEHDPPSLKYVYLGKLKQGTDLGRELMAEEEVVFEEELL